MAPAVRSTDSLHSIGLPQIDPAGPVLHKSHRIPPMDPLVRDPAESYALKVTAGTFPAER